MKEQENGTTTQGGETKKTTESKYQFSLKEISELANEPKVLQIMINIADKEENKGKTGQYLLSLARGIHTQLMLM